VYPQIGIPFCDGLDISFNKLRVVPIPSVSNFGKFSSFPVEKLSFFSFERAVNLAIHMCGQKVFTKKYGLFFELHYLACNIFEGQTQKPNPQKCVHAFATVNRIP
jgi:hypothetical protein